MIGPPTPSLPVPGPRRVTLLWATITQMAPWPPPYNEPNRDTFYGGSHVGYTDYETISKTKDALK